MFHSTQNEYQPFSPATRMHSSRMRTGRLSPVSPSMHCSRGGAPGPGAHLVWGMYMVLGRGVYLLPGECTWSGGCTWSRQCPWSQGGVPAPRVCTWSGGGGVYLPRGVYLVPGGVPAQGVCTCPGGPGPGVPAQVLPPPREQNDNRCKNITLPQTSFAGGKNVFHINIIKQFEVTEVVASYLRLIKN